MKLCWLGIEDPEIVSNSSLCLFIFGGEGINKEKEIKGGKNII